MLFKFPGVTDSMIFRTLHKAPTGLLAVVAMALGTVATAPAQTSLTAKIAARPLTRGDLTAYKLAATTQLSGGLNTVGVGEPLYLEAQVDSTIPAANITGVTWEMTLKPLLSKAVLADSPLGKEVPVYEPSDRLVVQAAGRAMLRPDVSGQYVVTATVSTTSAGTVRVAQTFFAATYVGIATCTRCHGGGLAQNMAVSWSKTAHANLFKDGVTASPAITTPAVAWRVTRWATTLPRARRTADSTTWRRS